MPPGRVELVAFVFMPEHVHLLIRPLDDLPNLGRYLAMVKRATSGSLRERLTRDDSQLLESLLIQERPGKVCFRFWQEGAGYDRNLSTADAIQASIEYIHGNPVKRGLCQRMIDWKWSSARYDHAVPLGQQYAGFPQGSWAGI
ncbi:hypothetical protein K2X85_14440 [bacterium]|nr:hypothetical protein [bacterium]